VIEVLGVGGDKSGWISVLSFADDEEMEFEETAWGPGERYENVFVVGSSTRVRGLRETED